MSWDQKLYLRHLTTRRFGRELEHFGELDSTNRWLIENEAEFLTTGAVVVADHQTAGRGRLQRVWFDLPERSLLFSLLLRYHDGSFDVPLLSLLPGIVLAEYLGEKLPVEHRIALKWPNDVLLNGRKISGVLGQADTSGAKRIIVLGMGINVSGSNREFPAEIMNQATSIDTEVGQVVPREALLAEILNRMESIYDEVLDGDTESIRRRWLHYGPEIGARVFRRDGDRTINGTFAGLGENGQLLLRDAEGKTTEIVSGDIDYL